MRDMLARSRRHLGRRLVAASLALSLAAPVVLEAPLAYAQDAAAIAKARETYREGIASEAAGKWEQALAQFKSVALVKSTAQVRYHIGFCQEKIGQYVDALGSYRLALHEAIEAKAKDVQKATQDRISALEPKIPKLTIHRGDGAQVAEVTMDGLQLGAASVGTAIPANPGPHVIKATAPGRKDFTAELTLADGETKTVELVLPEAAVADDKPASPPPQQVVVVEQPKDAVPAKTSPVKIAGFVIGGAGLVSLGVSAVFFAKRASAISDLDAVCGADRQSCPASAATTRDSGQSAATISTATFIAGLGGLAIGTVMILAAPKPKAPEAPTVGLALGGPGGPGGASLFGTF